LSSSDDREDEEDVPSSVVLEVSVVESLSDIGRLLLDGDKNVAGLVVESLLGGIVSDVLDGLSDDGLEVNLSLGGDLSEDHDHTEGEEGKKGRRENVSALGESNEFERARKERSCSRREIWTHPVLAAVSQATLDQGSWARQASSWRRW